MDGQRTQWAEYSEQLYTEDPPNGNLQTDELQEVDADSPISEVPFPLGMVRNAVARLQGGEIASLYNISAELLKAIVET